MEKLEKLELKYLANYLPYNIIGISPSGNKFYLSTSSNMLGKGIESRNIDTFLNDEFKLILRPLSDLTKEIEVNGERFVPIEYLYKNLDCDAEYDFIWAIEDDISSVSDKIIFAPYSIVEKLFEWHFDTNGLIEKGLAVDFNTLQNG